MNNEELQLQVWLLLKTTIRILPLFFVVTLFLSSCCTTSDMLGMNSADNHLFIDSKTPGSKVYLNGKLVGQTPYSYYGTKANIKKITVTNNYATETQKTERKNKGSIYWNFVPWPLYNWIWGYFLDYGNGTGRKYKSNTFYFNI